MEPGTDPADTPDSFRLRSLTTARSSDQDFRGTVLSGTGCWSAPESLLMDVSIIFHKLLLLLLLVLLPVVSRNHSRSFSERVRGGFGAIISTDNDAVPE